MQDISPTPGLPSPAPSCSLGFRRIYRQRSKSRGAWTCRSVPRYRFFSSSVFSALFFLCGSLGFKQISRKGPRSREAGTYRFVQRCRFFSYSFRWLVLSLWLSFKWSGCCGFRFRLKSSELPTPFYSVLVSISVFMALLAVFQSINSPDNSAIFESVPRVLCLPYWSFQLCISL